MKSNKKKILIGLLVSILFIYFIIKNVDLSIIWINIQGLSWYLYVVILVIYLVNLVLRTFRWQIVIQPISEVKFVDIFKALVYGYMLNQILPVKVGEVARAEYLTRKNKVSRSSMLGTVAVERVFDMLVVLLFFGISVLFSETVMNRMESSWLPVSLLIVGFILIIIIFLNLNFFKYFTTHLPIKLNKFIDGVIDNLSYSFKIFYSIKNVFKISIITLLVWLLTCLSCYLIVNELGIQIPYYAYFFIVSAGTFGMIIPSTSGNIGVYHGVAMAALMLFMVSKEEALSYAIISHAFDFIPNIVLGTILYFSNFNKSLSHV